MIRMIRMIRMIQGLNRTNSTLFNMPRAKKPKPFFPVSNSFELFIRGSFSRMKISEETQALPFEERFLLFRKHFENSYVMDFDFDGPDEPDGEVSYRDEPDGEVSYRMSTTRQLMVPLSEFLIRWFPEKVVRRSSAFQDSLDFHVHVVSLEEPTEQRPAGTIYDSRG